MLASVPACAEHNAAKSLSGTLFAESLVVTEARCVVCFLDLQAKRTNVGIALVSNPRVLFLDEPTSGLDSYTASEVMEVVKARRES